MRNWNLTLTIQVRFQYCPLATERHTVDQSWWLEGWPWSRSPRESPAGFCSPLLEWVRHSPLVRVLSSGHTAKRSFLLSECFPWSHNLKPNITKSNTPSQPPCALLTHSGICLCSARSLLLCIFSLSCACCMLPKLRWVSLLACTVLVSGTRAQFRGQYSSCSQRPGLRKAPFYILLD